MQELPIEIWSHIASFSSPEDLLVMCMVSTLHLDVSRRVLARDIVLDGKQQRSHSENLKFLTDKGLARSVRTLVVKNFDHGMTDDPLTYVRDMINLRALKIRNCKALFLNTLQQRLFANGLLSTKIKSVSISVFTSTLRGTQFAIAGLNDLEWKQSRGKFHPTFFSLCKASCATIISLSIVIRSIPAKPSVYGDVFELRFPRLSALKIGPGHSGFSDERYESVAEDTGSAFTKFLAAHFTLEELVIHWDYEGMQSTSETTLPVQVEPMKSSSFLPNLHTLDALPYLLIGDFIPAEVPFLRTLTSLHLYQKPIWAHAFVELMQSWKAYNAQYGPTPIVHLKVSIEDVRSRDPDEFISLMELAAEVFPNLESWASPTPTNMASGANFCDTVFSDLTGSFMQQACLVTAFSRFHLLKELACSVGSQLIDMSLAKILIEGCPSLKCIKCLNSGRLYRVIREEVGAYKLQTGTFKITESDLMIRSDIFRGFDCP